MCKHTCLTPLGNPTEPPIDIVEYEVHQMPRVGDETTSARAYVGESLGAKDETVLLVNGRRLCLYYKSATKEEFLQEFAQKDETKVPAATDKVPAATDQENKRLSASPGKAKRKLEEGEPNKKEATSSKKSKSATGMKAHDEKNDTEETGKEGSEMEMDESEGEESWKDEDVGAEEEKGENESNNDSPIHSASLGNDNSQPMMEWGIFEDILQFMVEDAPVADDPPIEEENIAEPSSLVVSAEDDLLVAEGAAVIMEEEMVEGINDVAVDVRLSRQLKERILKKMTKDQITEKLRSVRNGISGAISDTTNPIPPFEDDRALGQGRRRRLDKGGRGFGGGGVGGGGADGGGFGRGGGGGGGGGSGGGGFGDGGRFGGGGGGGGWLQRRGKVEAQLEERDAEIAARDVHLFAWEAKLTVVV
ncbi:uncharacterized protein LOC131858955 [Cryptomeria japonica]|uniref:uncharacterized protein LOC131858955 n=1 Tax=Cryptomeria japonica TaxID=3369 RepID=UPI0027DA8EB7|nr:uncharacterized protein LOC131858955 [Cryptomeria japonica]